MLNFPLDMHALASVGCDDSEGGARSIFGAKIQKRHS